MKIIKELLYLSNLISLSRLMILPFLIHSIYHSYFIMSIILLVIMIISDLLDGYIARKLHLISQVGKGLDPLMDKICLTTLFYHLLKIVNINMIPFYIMIVRDIILILLGVIAIYKQQPITGADIFGKITTFNFAFAILIFLIHIHYPAHNNIYIIALLLYYTGTFTLIITLFTYGKTAFKLLKIAFNY